MEHAHPPRTRGGEGLHVAAFGKHPGWNDHIDDLGLDTPRLIEIKRRMYVEGIGGNIDAGTWDRLAPEQQVEGYNHVFVWRTPASIVVGRMWSSRDGKGRTKYPMVVCAECRGVPLAWALGEGLPILDRLRERCVATESADAVRAAMDEAEAALRDRAAAQPPSGPELLVSDRVLAELAQRPEMGAGSVGLLRLMYQVEREMADYKPWTRTATRAKLEAPRPCHVRAPACGTDPAEIGTRWMHAALTLLAPGTEVLVFIALGAGWVDVIVGNPDPASFFCVRANPRALAPVTDVPYDLDAEFTARARQRLAGAGSDEYRPLGGQGAPVETVVRPGILSKMAFWKRRSTLILGLLAGLAITFAALGLLLDRARTGAGDDSAQRANGRDGSPTRAPPGGTEKNAPSSTPDPTLAAWSDLCAMYRGWFAQFSRQLDEPPARVAPGIVAATRRELYAADPTLKPLLERLATGGGTDPWSIAGVTRRVDLATLTSSPPGAVRTPAAAQRVTAGLDAARGFTAALRGECDAMRQLSGGVASAVARKWGAVGEHLGAVAARCATPGSDSASALDDTIAAAELVRRIEESWARVARHARATAAAGDRVPEAYGSWAERAGREAAGAGFEGLIALDLAAAEADRVGLRLVEFLAGDWTTIDRDAFLASGAHAKFTDPTPAAFDAWVFEARRYPSLDPALNPVRTWGGDARLSQVRAQAERLRAEFGDPSAQDAALRALGDRVDRLKRLPWNAANRDTITAEAASIEAELDAVWRTLDRRLVSAASGRVASAAEARAGLRARTRVSASSDAVNTAWLAWRDAILTTYDDARYADMLAHARAAEAALTALDERLAGGLAPPDPARPWHEALASAARSERERRVGAAVAGIVSTPPGVNDRAPPSFEDEAGAFDRFVEQLGSLRGDLDAADRLLQSGHRAEDRGSDGVSAADLVARCASTPVASTPGVEQAVAPFRERVAALERLAGETGRGVLVARVESAGAGDAAEALTAWRRLGGLIQPPWPSGPDELRVEAGLRAAIERVITAVPDSARRDALGRELAAEGAARWTRAAAAARTPADFDAIADQMGAFGVAPDAIADERTRFNLAARDAIAATAQPGMSDDAARRAAGVAAAKLRSAGPGIVARPPVAALLAELEALASGVEPVKPKPEVRDLGPGSIGWASEELDGGARVRFTSPGGALSLEFIRVEAAPSAGGASGSTEPVYVGAAEATLAVMTEVSRLPGAREALAMFLPDIDRPGPLGWSRGPGGFATAAAWIARLPAGSKSADYPALEAAGRPTADHPAQHVSPAAAMYAAARLGCRLPSTEEWRASLAHQARAASPAATPNLRDTRWQGLWASAEAVRLKGGKPFWPDAGIFVPAGGDKGGEPVDRSASHPGDDGALWFTPASSDGGIIHLVGNVAEFVFDGPSLGGAPADVTPEAVDAVLRASPALLRVIGGSALSPPAQSTDQPFPVDALDLADRVGYADVGFRLTFGADGPAAATPPPRDRLRRLLHAGVYQLE
ncbi:MAG: hypothetical protein ACKVU4_13895 [Phycisphaerales bacterium]